jgi:hypothetical protein
MRVTPKPLCLHHRFRQNQAQSANHTQFTANISQPKGNESNPHSRVSGGYSRHSNMSLGSGRATICGGGSCNPAKPKPTVRNRATTKPNQSNAHQSTPIQPELTLQSAWYSFWSRLRQPFSAMAKPYHRLHGDRTRRNPKAIHPRPPERTDAANPIGDPIQSIKSSPIPRR